MRAGVYCLIGILLLSACQTAAPSPTPQPTPTATPAATRTAFVMPTEYPTLSPVPVTPSQTAVKVDTFTGLAVQPPLTIALPEGWGSYYDTAFVNVVGQLTYVPIGFYQGPVTGGTGTIALVWNFGSVTNPNPFSEDYGKVNLLSDGELFLRQLVMEIGCNIGLEPPRTDLTLGNLPATGRFWSAVTCPDELPDTRGWYVARQDLGIGFIFYAFTDPIEAMDGAAKDELQDILDTVVLRVADVPTATPGTPTAVGSPAAVDTAVAPIGQATATP